MVVNSYEGPLPLRYVFENNQGLSFARNTAIQVCRGDLLLFTDDDVEVSPLWLSEYVKAAKKFQEADYFGGRILPLWPDLRPSWIKDEGMPLLGGLFVYYDLGTENCVYNTEDPTPYGASFGIRRKLFEQIKPFRTDLGVSGEKPGRGEETEYLTRARNFGFRGAYVGKSLCYHRVDPTRLRLRYLYRFGVQKGITENIMNPSRNSTGSFRRELSYGIRGIGQLAKGRGDRFRQCVINMGIQAGLRQSSRE